MIYILQRGPDGPVKIGYAENVEKRVKSLQTASPERLRLLCSFPGERELERRCHERFSEWRMRGEWFHPSRAMDFFTSDPIGTLFEWLITEEPALGRLKQQVIEFEDDMGTERFCANSAWYGYFKPLLLGLVGREARKESLRSRDVYDVAYDVLYSLLPDCRNCSCIGVSQ